MEQEQEKIKKVESKARKVVLARDVEDTRNGGCDANRGAKLYYVVAAGGASAYIVTRWSAWEGERDRSHVVTLAEAVEFALGAWEVYPEDYPAEFAMAMANEPLAVI